MFRKIITYLTIYSFLYSNVCFAAMITPDGRTQTAVSVNGNTYHVKSPPFRVKTRSIRFPILPFIRGKPSICISPGIP